MSVFSNAVKTTGNNGIKASAGNYIRGANGAAASIVFDAVPGKCNVVAGFVFAYDSDPQAGAYLQVIDDTTVVYKTAITSRGPGPILLPAPIVGTAGKTMTVTLSAGGGTVNADLNVMGYLQAP